MGSQKDLKKLKISSKRIILIYIVLFIVFEAIFYLSFQSGNFWPLSTSFYFYTPILLGMTILFCVLSLTKTYYEMNDKIIIHHKMGKETTYNISNIIFVDEEWSVKHKMLHFYTKEGMSHYLAFDKEGLIYQNVMENSPLITEEEFIVRFPNIKL